MADDSHLYRPGSSRARHIADMSLSDKMKHLPKDIQSSFQQMMSEIYEQEHDSMMNIIEDARRSLAQTVDDLHDEQQVLSLTADKISQSRPSTARSTRRLASARPDCRSGIIAARHQRVLTAKKARQQQEDDQTPGFSARPRTARPTTARPTTAGSTSSSSTRRTPTPSSSMDSVTFETERNRALRRSPNSSPSSPVTSTSQLSLTTSQPADTSQPGDTTTSQPADTSQPVDTSQPGDGIASQLGLTRSATGTELSSTAAVAGGIAVVTIDSDDDYELEKNAIMKRMSSAETRVEQKREKQADKLRQRQEQKKAQQDRQEQVADALCREANALQEMKQKDKERQAQLIRERLEQRKRRQQGDADTSTTASVVVHVADPSNTVNYCDKY